MLGIFRTLPENLLAAVKFQEVSPSLEIDFQDLVLSLHQHLWSQFHIFEGCLHLCSHWLQI